MPLDLNILGEGVYSPREVARLIGGTSQDVLRWTRGSGPNDPLWLSHYHKLDDATELSFLDLVELRVVKAFRRAGVSLQAIRFAINFASEKYEVEHPLSSLRFKVGGQEILMEAVEKDGDYVSLSKKHPGQKAFAKIISQSLDDLEYEDNVATKWHPKYAKGVVLDPKRYFGDPILDEYGVSTKILAQEFSEHKNAKYLSKIYEIPSKAIQTALNFEKYLDTQQ